MKERQVSEQALNLNQWVANHCGLEHFEPDLSRIQSFFNDLNIQNLPKIITIAGTNGKGQTTFYLEQMLREKNCNVATWTSPHLHSVCERMRYNGELISSDLLKILFEKAKDIELKLHIKLSYYEFLFASFLLWLKQLDLDFILLEVGLGGRLDAVKIMEADVVLLTSISRDHQQFLGKYYHQILKEKLAVMSDNSFLIYNLKYDYLRDLTRTYLQESKNKSHQLHAIGDFANQNYQLALSCINYFFEATEGSDSLDFSHDVDPRQGQIKFDSNIFSFYGAHNLDALRNLFQFLVSNNYNKDRFDKVYFAFSSREFNDLCHMMSCVDQLYSQLVHKENSTAKLYFIEFDHERAIGANEFKQIENLRDRAFENIEICSRPWKQEFLSLQDSKALVFGSYFFLGQCRQFISHSSNTSIK